jgi:hypothetical protein
MIAFISGHAMFRDEYAIVPDLSSSGLLVDGCLLLIPESVASFQAAQSINSLHENIDTPLHIQIVLMLLPDHPIWFSRFSELVSLPPTMMKCLDKAIRFHVNSSSLWNFRRLLFRETSTGKDLEQEVKFLLSVSQFKSHNYHVFSYWNSIVCASDLMGVHFQYLIQFIKRNPSNFSPYQVILTSLSVSPEKVDDIREILKKLSAWSHVTSTEAFREFVASCAYMLEFEDRKSIEDLFGSYSVLCYS